MTQKKIGRRRFLKKSIGTVVGTAAFPYIVASSALGKEGGVAASERIVMGCIGVGSQGTGNMQAFLGHKDVQVVAVCDVVEERRQKAKGVVDQRYGSKDCAAYNDFRDVLARKDINAVSIVAGPLACGNRRCLCTCRQGYVL